MQREEMLNKFLQVFRTWNGITPDSNDLVESIAIGRGVAISILARKNDDRYEVKYEFMGDKMHNYRCYFEGKPIRGYVAGTSEDCGWIMCHEHHIRRISKLL